ncbi:unnamed protein product [Ascophyllum nodosum]
MRIQVVRSFQAAARSQHLSSCPRVLCGSQGKGAVFVGCRRKPAHGNIWGSRRASSAMPDDALYLPMPKLSPSMTEGTITAWHKAEGDEVDEYDTMMEITTDSLYAAGDGGEGGPVKMVIEVVEAGFVGKLLAAQGDTVKVGRPVMVMCEEEENVDTLRAAPTPPIDLYGDDASKFRMATYQGYLQESTQEK